MCKYVMFIYSCVWEGYVEEARGERTWGLALFHIIPLRQGLSLNLQ